MKVPLPTSEKSAAAPVPTSFRKAAVIEGEIRSLNHETAMELLETYYRTFQQEADEDWCEAGLGRKAEYPCV